MARPHYRRWRTNIVEIKEIMAPGQDYDLANNPTLDPFIMTAWSVVNDIINYEWKHGMFDGLEHLYGSYRWKDQCDVWHHEEPGCYGEFWPWGTDRHKLIEVWLACHFYKLSDRGLSSESVNGASGGFMGTSGMGFDATQYGQNAKRLDRSGYLVILDERRIVSGGITAPGAVASMAYVGTNCTDDSQSSPYCTPVLGRDRNILTPG